MDTSRTRSPFSKRRLGVAGSAAILACAACCALPFVTAAGIGGGAAAALGRIFHPGSELLIGGAIFAAALAVMAIRDRRRHRAGCGPSCDAAGDCCDRGRAPAGTGGLE